MRTEFLLAAILCALAAGAADVVAQEREARPDPFKGSAVVRVEDHEYKITILCNDADRPELGFTTEAARVTRAATGGRYNMIQLRVRPWKDTEETLVSLGGYVAWIPHPSSVGGVLALDLDLSPGKMVKDNVPVLLTYDMWTEGERPEGGQRAAFEATCSSRDPEAPAYRRIPQPGRL